MIRLEKNLPLSDGGNIDLTFEKFNGINDFLEKYENAPISKAYSKDYTADHLKDDKYEKYNQDQSGVYGFPDAIDKFKNGVNVQAMKSARMNASTGTKKEIKKSVAGGRVCVPAYLNGSPACMRKHVNRPAKNELNLIVDTTVPWKVKGYEVVEAGKKIVEYLSIIENDYSVNLHVIALLSFNRVKVRGAKGKYICKDAYGFGIQIKEAGKPFSASRVSFCLTSPAFLRVFGFIWTSRAEGIPYDSCYGYPLSHEPKKEKEVLSNIYKNSKVISIYDVIRYGEKAFK